MSNPIPNTNTTMLRRRDEGAHKEVEGCHAGVGAINVHVVMQGEATGASGVRFMHDTTLPPGTSIGVHQHDDETEYYYIVDGEGTMTLDGETFKVAAGDITAVFPGGSHGIVNDSASPLRLVVLSVMPA